MINNNPIGLFDSGIGGTSIWKEIHHLLPNEDTIYLADSINAPYGEKSKEEIIHLSCKNTEFLLNLKKWKNNPINFLYFLRIYTNLKNKT
jgi:glutamate racemase